MSRVEEGVSHAVGEVKQQLESDVQAAASGTIAMSMQQMKALVGAFLGRFTSPKLRTGQ